MNKLIVLVLIAISIFYDITLAIILTIIFIVNTLLYSKYNLENIKGKFKDNVPKEDDINSKIKDLENKGYAFDSADASFELLAKKTLTSVKNYFELISFKVTDERQISDNNLINLQSKALIKIKINDKIIIDWRFLTHATIEKDQKPLNSELI